MGFETMLGATRKNPMGSLRTAVNIWYMGGPQPVITTPIRSLTGRYDHCMAISADRKLTGTLGGQGVKWTVIDTKGKTVGNRVPGTFPDQSAKIAAMRLSPDGHWLALTTVVGSVAMHSMSPGESSMEETPAHSGWATVLGFSADSRTFMTRRTGPEGNLVGGRARRPKNQRMAGAPGVELWRFSPDGRFAAMLVPNGRFAIVRLSAPFQQP